MENTKDVLRLILAQEVKAQAKAQTKEEDFFENFMDLIENPTQV